MTRTTGARFGLVKPLSAKRQADRILARFEEPKTDFLGAFDARTGTFGKKKTGPKPMGEKEIFKLFKDTYHSLEFVLAHPLLLAKAEMLRLVRGHPHNFYDAARVRLGTDKHLGENGILAYLLNGSGWFVHFKDPRAKIIETVTRVEKAPLDAQIAAFDTRTGRANWHDIERRWMLLERRCRRYLALDEALGLMEPAIAERIRLWLGANPSKYSAAARRHELREINDPLKFHAPKFKAAESVIGSSEPKKPSSERKLAKKPVPPKVRAVHAKKISSKAEKPAMEKIIPIIEIKLAPAPLAKSPSPSASEADWEEFDAPLQTIQTWDDFTSMWDEVEQLRHARMPLSQLLDYLDINDRDTARQAHLFVVHHPELVRQFILRYDEVCRADRELAMRKRDAKG